MLTTTCFPPFRRAIESSEALTVPGIFPEGGPFQFDPTDGRQRRHNTDWGY
jgi:hypothetical protein